MRTEEKWQPQGRCSGLTIVLADLFELSTTGFRKVAGIGLAIVLADLFEHKMAPSRPQNPDNGQPARGKKGWRKQNGKWKQARAPKWKRDARKAAVAEAAEAQLLTEEDASLSVNPVREEEGLTEEWIAADNANLHAGKYPRNSSWVDPDTKLLWSFPSARVKDSREAGLDHEAPVSEQDSESPVTTPTKPKSRSVLVSEWCAECNEAPYEPWQTEYGYLLCDTCYRSGMAAAVDEGKPVGFCKVCQVEFRRAKRFVDEPQGVFRRNPEMTRGSVAKRAG